MFTSRMTYPAPRRCSVETGGRSYYTTSWNLREVWLYRKAGGWFAGGCHEFDSVLTAEVALAKDITNLRDEVLVKVANRLIDVE